MTKKITGIIVFILLIAAILYSYWHYREIKAPVGDALSFIPADAALILRINNTQQFTDRLKNGNIIWEELASETESFKKLNQSVSILDSLYHTDSFVQNTLDDSPLYVSIVMTGANRYNLLYTASLRYPGEAKAANEILKKSFPGAVYSQRNYENTVIHSLKHKEGEFFYSSLDGVVIASQSSLLVENSISRYLAGQSLYNDKVFYQLHGTAGAKISANLFANYKELSRMASIYFENKENTFFDMLSGLGYRATLDINVKPNAVMLNGFTATADTTQHYLGLFSRQKTREAEVIKIIPSSCNYFVFQGFSNFSTFYSAYKEYTAPESKANKEEAATDESEKRFLSWIAGEAVAFQVKDTIPFLAFRASGIENAQQLLVQEENTADETYNGYKLVALKEVNPYGMLLGPLFSSVETPHFCILDPYIVWANNFESLRLLIDEYINDRTLLKDTRYAAFSENLSAESNLFFYYNIAAGANQLISSVKDKYSEGLGDHAGLIRKFEAVAFQFSSSEGLFYNNIYLKYNPNPTPEDGQVTQWEVRLDTTSVFRPRIVTNHTNNQKDILVQDESNKLYLISNTGKILWKKQLNERIMEEVYQVDAFGNNKLQLLFNTGNYLHLIDRNGNYVDNYPVKLKSEASSPLALMDYDNNKQYRVLISCKDKKIYNYSVKGDFIQGWNIPETTFPIELQIQHTEIGGKDYIVAVDKGGNIYGYDRKGDIRLSLKEKLSISPKNRFYLEKGKSLARSFIIATDSLGNILKLSLNDELEQINIKELSSSHYFDYRDINNDRTKEYILAEGKKIAVYSQDKLPVFNLELTHDLLLAPQYYNDGMVGIVDLESREVVVYDARGNPLISFPVKGSTHFSIDDINSDRKQDMVIGFEDKILVYELRN